MKHGDRLNENLSRETVFLATTLDKTETETKDAQYRSDNFHGVSFASFVGC